MTKRPPFNWRDHLAVHKAADLFPLMSEADPAALKKLADDIKKDGLLVPIVIWQPEPDSDHCDLIDGRNRLDAMALAGVLHDRKLFDLRHQSDPIIGGDPYAIALSLNVHRRHLTPKQKRELIAKVLKATPKKSNRQIAKEVEASHPHIAKVRKELEKTGDVETVSTSIDTKGRKQPTKRKGKVTKPKPKPGNGAAINGAVDAPKPEPKPESSQEVSAEARRAYDTEHESDDVRGDAAADQTIEGAIKYFADSQNFICDWLTAWLDGNPDIDTNGYDTLRRTLTARAEVLMALSEKLDKCWEAA
jgi:hypothetical protein